MPTNIRQLWNQFGMKKPLGFPLCSGKTDKRVLENDAGIMFCPLCKNDVKQWDVFISLYPRVACPICISAERHRMIALFLDNQQEKYDNFLHIAPERILHNIFRSRSKNYICGDINPKGYSDLNAIYLDATDIHFENNYFDCIFASHILEHIIEDTKAMNEMYRTLKKGGKLIAMIPQNCSLDKTYEDPTIVTPEARTKAFGQWDHVRYYGPDFSERLRNCGFYIKIYYLKDKENDIEKMFYDEKHLLDVEYDDNEYAELLGVDCRTKYNLNIHDIVYVCVKQ